ncbi:cobalamin biosynthesis protein CbiD [Ancylomarina euxinus]|uniref:Cobalt-precorrin-5B C(1)-methyltransferase n=1 Tax=Ancylomarina euxinus TaxID=2283627 RepID=A0A425XYQ7_9BACT|nr:cobalt-precorrin-5B (C(1))-methyltransferase CbiD [Ancylomarina euxinus]MCZ4695766.1 cobalt-precorrin-5B (C(1))-methyltransferase CbiD [Ancylomarina euxinus]MUP16219.1 cobalamin biosynthesis protein CbiD [Ancylomarina euxinus]RRG20077.1 cobalamin biosynthesis protein CbiD [Ancylomarina euxinus]
MKRQILIFGGTTEGRKTANWLSDLKQLFYYSTKTNSHPLISEMGECLSGGMNEEEMIEFCRIQEIKLIVDAAHPFAADLHFNLHRVASELDIAIVRIEREFVERVENEHIHYLPSMDDCIESIQNKGIERVLSLVGVKNLPKIRKALPDCDIWFRILNFPDSIRIANDANVKVDRLIVSSRFENLLLEEALIKENAIQAIMTKESGYSGLLDKKMDLAIKLEIPLFIVKRPDLPEYDKIIKTRSEFQSYLDEVFGIKRLELAHGYTTGTCASISAKAALIALINQEKRAWERVDLPKGKEAIIPIHYTEFTKEYGICTVIKNSGDDPDVTDGTEIGCRISFNDTGEIRFVKGEGVGIVTKAGLEMPIGDPAVNPTPRKIIERELNQILNKYQLINGVDVSIFVPMGAKLAKKTFNPRLGIEGGISIIGTTGILKPFSAEAYVQTIKKHVRFAVENGSSQVFINSGGRSERYLKLKFPEMPQQAYIQYGNFIGDTIHAINGSGVEKVSMGIMMGKAVKLAEGHLDTHSKKVVFNKDFLIELAKEANYDPSYVNQIKEVNMARDLEGIFPFNEDEVFYKHLKSKCCQVLEKEIEDYEIELLLMNIKGEII